MPDSDKHELRSRVYALPMLKRLTLPLALLALLVIVVPADAKQRPTNRARIHALEKKMLRLSAEVDALTQQLEVARAETKPAVDLAGCLYELPFMWDDKPGDPATIPPRAEVFATIPGAPLSQWIVLMKPACLTKP